MPTIKSEPSRRKKNNDNRKHTPFHGYTEAIPVATREHIIQSTRTCNFDGMDFIDRYFSSDAFRKIVDSGKYIFLDGRIILKSKSCLRLSDSGLQISLPKSEDLTAYCSNFYRTLKGVSFGPPSRAKKVRPLRNIRRDRAWRGHIRATDIPVVKIEDPQGKVLLVGHRTRSRYSHSLGTMHLAKSWSESYEQAKKITSLKDITTSNLFLFLGGGQEPPNNFSEALIFFMEERNITVERLADETGLSEKTIQRLRNNPEIRPTLETVIAICVGLHLDAYSGDTLVYLAGYRLTNKKCEKMYRLFINFAFKETVFECNNALIRCGLKPLTNLHN